MVVVITRGCPEKMIEKIGGYRRYSCKKCREGNHWVWSWRCVEKPEIGRKYRDDYDRGDLDNSVYKYDGELKKLQKPISKNKRALNKYRMQYSRLSESQKEDIDELYDDEVENINNDNNLGPAVPQPTEDVITGKDRYWVSLSESLNVDDPKPDCHKCGYGIVFCEPHWEVTGEHYGNTTGDSTYYHPWCYKQ